MWTNSFLPKNDCRSQEHCQVSSKNRQKIILVVLTLPFKQGRARWYGIHRYQWKHNVHIFHLVSWDLKPAQPLSHSGFLKMISQCKVTEYERNVHILWLFINLRNKALLNLSVNALKVGERNCNSQLETLLDNSLPLWDINFSRRDGCPFSGPPFDCS